MKLNLSRYQVKLVALCLLIGVIPVTVLGVFSYVRTSSLIERKVLQGNDQLLLQTQTQLENTLKIVDFSIFQLANSQEVNDALQIRIEAKDFPVVDKLSDMLQRIQIYELGIRDIHLINIARQWVINNRGYASLNDFAKAYPLTSLMSSDKPYKWLTLVSGGQGGEPRHASIYLVKRFPNYSAKPSGLLVTEMSDQELFKQLPASSELGSVIVLDERGDNITAGRDAALDRALRNSPLPEEIRQSEASSGYRVGRIGQDQYGFTFRKSAYNGWTYLLIVSLGSIKRESQAIGWATAWACAVIIAIVVVLSLRGAGRLYSPLRRLYQMTAGPGEEPDPKQPKDEFAAIERRVEAMSRSYTHLNVSMEKLTRQLKPVITFRLVQGGLPAKEIDEQVQLFGCAQPYRRLAVAIIRIDSLERTRYLESDRSLLLFALSNIVEETVPPEHRLCPVVIDQAQVTVFRGNQESPEAFKAYLTAALRQIRDNAKSYLGLSVSAGISRPYEAYADTPAAYAEGLDALKYRITRNSETVFFLEDEEPGVQMVMFPEHLEKQLVEAVKFSDEGRASALLKEFLHILSNRELTHNQMQNWLTKLLLDLLYLAEQPDAACPPLDTNATPLYEQLKRLHTLPEIETWFMQRIVEPLIRAGEAGNEAPYDKIAQEIVRMIRSEYDRELTLEECASRLNYHPSYIRRALKKSLNTNFTDCLLAYRMEIAKRWLTDTEMKIADMSRKLQYNNPQNFIRYFKKSTGMTPGQFRENSGGG
ncbi:helix-turn-helix domain-containing protein [Paenibacillus humicola]|uniref:helix-turn-helix domain-containing protein n=1 Tax=Paenibacillus humicola TaxID=3110540 RepID=UPI00237BB674|nr:helix-turn-helix domain-containing protein [Paenibacillus humicola]